jgi:hypothetical protein
LHIQELQKYIFSLMHLQVVDKKKENNAASIMQNKSFCRMGITKRYFLNPNKITTFAL